MHRILIWLVLVFVKLLIVPVFAVSGDDQGGMILNATSFPKAGEPLEVCLLRAEETATVVLSDDLEEVLGFWERSCLPKGLSCDPLNDGHPRAVQGCGPSGECFGPSLLCCDLSVELSIIGRYGRFMLYRQVAGEEYLPLGLFTDIPVCTVMTDHGVPMSRVDDAPLYLVRFEVGGIYAQVPGKARLTETTRLVFADRQVRSKGNQVRYKLVVFDPGSGSPSKIHTSDWLYW
ncbi:hypothetical protein DSLASN_28720 [Desulfoluna limicola]|uniref:Uncharacterized protein n=1 Tax=Desulfoluna limicola TaxID=2810562 RepID=A0ABM7PI36_9BACT|nr:hypothetical protein [Desulfoluna limicola]BCS97240.1 hypothetical protein DSLASN_28720 [Desulfoluna limicola]